ncbi:MAG: C_GCAxxG_C_C family protein [Clostridia bacterium]|nr:C_GCAxxG_C_C family protein [Clostridia bacterium]
MSRAERAKEYFLQGYACSQAVALAFSDVMGLDEATISKIMLPFGGGVGRLRMTCGAVSGMAAVIGMTCAKSENTPENKKATYAIVQELCAKFKAETGSLICAELLSGMKVAVEIGGTAEARTEQYYHKRSCGEMVALAAKIVEEYLISQGIL